MIHSHEFHSGPYYYDDFLISSQKPLFELLQCFWIFDFSIFLIFRMLRFSPPKILKRQTSLTF
jgi:hypothetical protein